MQERKKLYSVTQNRHIQEKNNLMQVEHFSFSQRFSETCFQRYPFHVSTVAHTYLAHLLFCPPLLFMFQYCCQLISCILHISVGKDINTQQQQLHLLIFLCILKNQAERQIYNHKGSQVTFTIKEVRIWPISTRICINCFKFHNCD